VATRNGARPDDRLYAGELEYYKPAGWARGRHRLVHPGSGRAEICAGYGQIKRIIPAAGPAHDFAVAARAIENLDPSIVRRHVRRPGRRRR
jgi:hypothetical protein